MNNKTLFILLAILIAFSFLSCNICLSKTSNDQIKNTDINKTIKDIHIPERIGSIVKKWIPDETDNYKLVFYINDAHCNYEAQSNIAQILEILIRDHGVDLVSIEGASGELNFSELGSLEDNNAREKASDLFMKKGIATGPEYLRITKYNELPFKLVGAEDGYLYVYNFRAFRDTICHAGETDKFIKNVNKTITLLKEKIYSHDLLEFDKMILDYENNNIELSNYVNKLSKHRKINNTDYPNLSTVSISTILEDKINFKNVEKERENLIKYLEKILSKEELKQFVKMSLKFKLEKMPSK